MTGVQMLTMFLGGSIAVLAGMIGRSQETVAAFVAMGGALWLGSVAYSLDVVGTSAGEALKSLMASILGLVILLLGLGTIFGIMAVIFYLLDNPFTGYLVYMPGSVSELVAPFLVPLILGPLFWLATWLMSRLTDDGDIWILGFWGALMSCFALTPIGLVGLFSYYLLTEVFNLPIGGAAGVVYFAIFGVLYGWAVPLVVHIMD
ncbi:MAG: hypothetical protein R3264_13995 [Anaerolineae bacterium]|nr:hypothetical protein [Anaerolineae bacterium]